MKKPIKKIIFHSHRKNEMSRIPSRATPELTDIQLEDWIDSQDVMQLLHISSRTLHTLRTNGTLPYSRIGYKFYYRKQDITKILSDNYTMYKIRNHGNK